MRTPSRHPGATQRRWNMPSNFGNQCLSARYRDPTGIEKIHTFCPQQVEHSGLSQRQLQTGAQADAGTGELSFLSPVRKQPARGTHPETS